MGTIFMRIKRPGLESISWIAFTRTLSRLCCMLEYIGSSTKIISGCYRKDSRYQIFAWDVVDKRLEDVKMSYFKDVTEKISQKNYRLLKDQG
jgi:hypothetical protein